MKHKRKAEHYFVGQPKSKHSLGLIRVHLRSSFFEFVTSSSVFSKKRVDAGTRLLVESVILPKEGCMLDLGCGYGPVGIVAAASQPNLRVFLVDVNKRAVWLAKQNAKRNNVGTIKVLRGFLYEPVEALEFDIIVCNPPVSAGMSIVSQIVTAAPEHLKRNGSLQLVARTNTGGKRIQRIMEEAFGNVKTLAKKGGYRVLLSKKP